MIGPIYKNSPAIIIGTGPSLAEMAEAVRASKCLKFGPNNTYQDFDLTVHCANDEKWWEYFYNDFAARRSRIISYHWDKMLCQKYGLVYQKGRQEMRLSTNPDVCHKGHSSNHYLLNIAFLLGCDPIYLVGYDMHYPKGKPRHYFDGLSDEPGEYPEDLRKYSPFEGRPGGEGGLIGWYEKIAEQIYGGYSNSTEPRPGFPRIYNCTPNSALTCFENFDGVPA